jgi:hypothetical protein
MNIKVLFLIIQYFLFKYTIKIHFDAGKVIKMDNS